VIQAATLGRLAHKYEVLAALRRARARGEPIPERAVFRDLAREFPGCLNELDTLPLDTLDARAASLANAAKGGPIEPWMEWLAGYHALLRAALRLKPRLSRGEPLDDARADRLARDASAHAGIDLDAAFVRGVADPPRGRLNTFVFLRLSQTHGHPPESIKRALFPHGRG
jgi:hypothetical protein